MEISKPGQEEQARNGSKNPESIATPNIPDEQAMKSTVYPTVFFHPALEGGWKFSKGIEALPARGRKKRRELLPAPAKGFKRQPE